MGPERTIWKLSAVIKATQAEADDALEAIARTLCPDDDHDGGCPVPWTLMACRFEDLEPEEQATWKTSFEDESPPAQ